MTVGFVGAYTTFSTFAYESLRQLQDGALGLAAANVAGSVVLGVLAAWVGVNRRQGPVRLAGQGKLLRIFIGESDRWHGKPLYQAIVEHLRAEGVAGATVIRAIEGYGARSHLHTSRILRLSEDLPLVIEVVDTDENIQRILPVLDDMVEDGMVTLERVEVITYRAGEAPPS